MELFRLYGSVFIDDKAALKSLDRVDERAGKSGKAFLGMSKAAVAASAAIGVAAFKFGKVAVSSAMDFEKGMANVATLLDGEVQPRIEELGSSIKQLMGETGQSAEVLQSGLYQVISAFGDTSDSLDILAIAAKGAVAGLADTESVVNLLAAAMKGYGDVSAESATKVSDLAFQTVKLGQTTMPELASSMGKIIPLANTLKISQEELFGAMATLTGMTGDTSKVSTQLQGAFNGLMKPTVQMEAALKKLGYSNGLAATKALGLQGTLDALLNSVNGNEIAFAGMFGSVEAAAGVLALAGSQSDNFARKTEAMGDAAGSTEEAYDKMQDTLQGSLDKLKSTIDAIVIDIGEDLIPAIKSITETLPETIDFWQQVFANMSENIHRTFQKGEYEAGQFADAYDNAAQAIATTSESVTNTQIQDIRRLSDAEDYALEGKLNDLQIWYDESIEKSDRMAKENRDTLRKRMDAESDAHDDRMDFINDEYDAAMDLLDDESNARIKALQNELDAMDDQESANKIADLKKKISTTRNLTRRKEYQKELEELEKEARKESIRDEIKKIREETSEKKDGLREDYENKKETEKDKYEETVDRLNDEIDAIEVYTGKYKGWLKKGYDEKVIIEKNKTVAAKTELDKQITDLEDNLAKRKELLTKFGNTEVFDLLEKQLKIQIKVRQDMLDAKAGTSRQRSLWASEIEDLQSSLKMLYENYLSSGGGGGSGGGDAFAAGTDYVPKTDKYLVGEKGPELVTLKKGSSVTPNNQLGGQAITVNVNYPFVLDGYGARKITDVIVKELKLQGLNPK